jgi:hypothetical protein
LLVLVAVAVVAVLFMSAKDEKRENQDLEARLAALSKKSAAEPASPAVMPLPEKKPKHISRGRKSSSKSLCHYMYVSPEEDLFFKRLIGKFIVTTGETIGASEALRIMMFATAEASDHQIIEAHGRARAGDGKRVKHHG